MRVKHKVNASLFRGTDMLDSLFRGDDTTAETVLDGHTKASVGQTTISGAFTLPMNGMTLVRGLFLRVDGGDATVTIDGEVLQVKRGKASASGTLATTARFAGDINAASVVVAPVSGSIEVSFAMWGDA